jgi:hypothetical protein
MFSNKKRKVFTLQAVAFQCWQFYGSILAHHLDSDGLEVP